MIKRVGKYLEMTGDGDFKLLENVPEGSIDAHVHLGAFTKLPILGGINLTGPGNYIENLKYHLDQLWKYKLDIAYDFRKDFLKGFTGLFDIAPLKTNLESPKTEIYYTLTGFTDLFDYSKPSFINFKNFYHLSFIKDLGKFYINFFHGLKQSNRDNLQSYLNEFGIEKAAVISVETNRFTRFSKELYDTCKDHSNLILFCSVHPYNPDMELTIVDYRSKGIVGLKFHPDFQGVSPDSKEALNLFDICQSTKMVVQCHVGWPIKGVGLSKPELYSKAIREFPDLKFVLCHIGLAEYEETINLASSYDNVFLETSGQPSEGIKKAASKIGADKIIFGTDWPVYHPAVPISAVMEAFPNESDRVKVFKSNFEKLLNL
ncbi:MAG: amidohydrolase family protein [Desulfobacterales bacterium]|nr:amidohydrolase family protein [Desulfobacterales bacterium]